MSAGSAARIAPVGQRPWGSRLSGAERDVAPRRSDLHPVRAPGQASVARLASLRPPLSLPLFLALSLSVPAERRSLSRSEPLRSARDESLQWHEFNSTLFILQPRTMWSGSTHVNTRLHLAGRSARGGGGGGRDEEEEEEAREGRGGEEAGAALPSRPSSRSR